MSDSYIDNKIKARKIKDIKKIIKQNTVRKTDTFAYEHWQTPCTFTSLTWNKQKKTLLS